MVSQLSDVVCHGVVTLRNSCMKQEAIAQEYGITQGAVSKILKRNLQMGTPTPKRRLSSEDIPKERSSAPTDGP